MLLLINYKMERLATKSEGKFTILGPIVVTIMTVYLIFFQLGYGL